MSRVEQLTELQSEAVSYGEWQAIAQQIDAEEHLDAWRQHDGSELYDYTRLRQQLSELRAARETGNYKKLLYLVRTTFTRNNANMGDPQLYGVAHVGTKLLIEEYISECERTLQHLSALPLGADELDAVLNTLVQTRKAFGRTALVLSGGSILGFMHIGVMRELIEQKLLPRIISGSSAGSIFASILCIHRDEEFDQMWDLLKIPMNIFERVGEEESLLTHLKRFCTVGTWIDSAYLREMMQGLIGDITFREAYNRTGRVLNINVSVAGSHEMPRLLNYLTAPNVVVWSAVVCSCSVPLIFQADSILAKNAETGELQPWTNRPYIDGSVDNDMPLGRLSEIFNVNHFVACQVNPHIAPLFKHDRSATVRRRSLLMTEVEYGLLMLKTARIAPSFASTMLNVIGQEYWGDITVVPQLHWRDLGSLFKNPSEGTIADLIDRGRRASWPKLALVRNHCAVELALDRTIVDLRARVIRQTEPSPGWEAGLATVPASVPPTPHEPRSPKRVSSAGTPPRRKHGRSRSSSNLRRIEPGRRPKSTRRKSDA